VTESCWVTTQIVLVPFLLLRMAYEVSLCSQFFAPFGEVSVLVMEPSPLFVFSGSGDPSSVPSSSSPLAGKTVVVIGAGGAGKALAYGAKEKGAKVVIANRTYGIIHVLNWKLRFVNTLDYSITGHARP